MGSLGTPKTWIPYMNAKDCSQGFCSLYCPQWCYIVFPPPPPIEFPGETSSSSFSPIVIAIIGILASAFLLVSYYTIISKYCGDNDPSRRGENQVENIELGEEDRSPSYHEPWHVSSTGLDEALIKSIAVYKYRKGDGAIDGIDCSVCLSEFEEDQSVRLLPKCSHAFHVPCIDTWLKSHSNCPLCRANIFFASTQIPPLPPQPAMEHPQRNSESSLQNGQGANENVPVADQNTERVVTGEEVEHNDRSPKAPYRTFSDLGNLHQRDTIVEVRDARLLDTRRSVSMDHHSCQAPSSSQVWQIDQDELIGLEEGCSRGVGTSKHPTAGASMSKYSPSPRTKIILQCVRSPIASKRPFPSGRFFLPTCERLRDAIVNPN